MFLFECKLRIYLIKIETSDKFVLNIIWKRLLTGTFSNVRRCWLAMPLSAGVLRWVLASLIIIPWDSNESMNH